MRTGQTRQRGWQRIVSTAGAIAASAVMAFALTACGDDDDAVAPPPATIAAPGAPTNFTVVRTPEVTLSADLAWAAPTAGGAPTTYEIYRSTTSGTVFQAANHVISLPATTLSFTDNAGLTPVDTYWVVSAKNAGGETPTAEFMYRPIGPPGGTGDTGFGNNFSSALIFADDIGIGGAALDPAKAWTTDATLIDYSTGLRPLITELPALAVLPVPVIVTTLPYFDPLTAFLRNGITYYKQQTASIWQGQWERGATAQQHVTAKWGDNLISQRLTTSSVIRIEMVLSKLLTTPMTSYTMQSLYGARENEVQGTDGTTYLNPTAFVFASNARLKIQKLDAAGVPVGAPLYNQALWAGDGPGFLAAEVNVAGNFTYGFVWNLKNESLSTEQKTGTWRLTFSLDPDNSAAVAGVKPGVPLVSTNTFIDTATNGVRVSDSEAYIDIVVQ